MLIFADKRADVIGSTRVICIECKMVSFLPFYLPPVNLLTSRIQDWVHKYVEKGQGQYKNWHSQTRCVGRSFKCWHALKGGGKGVQSSLNMLMLYVHDHLFDLLIVISWITLLFYPCKIDWNIFYSDDFIQRPFTLKNLRSMNLLNLFYYNSCI